MLRLYIDAQTVAVADDGVNQPVVRAALPEQLDALLAVLGRPELKVDIVQQADDRPEIGFVAIAQLLEANELITDALWRMTFETVSAWVM